MTGRSARKSVRQSRSVPAIAPLVEKVFATYPPPVRRQFRQLRRLIFQIAAELKSVGPITETLKWGEPAYLTEHSKSGSTIRFNWKSSEPDRLAICFNCQTRLVGHFKERFAHQFDYEGNRAIVLTLNQPVPETELRECLTSALLYHRIKARL